MFSLSQSK